MTGMILNRKTVAEVFGCSLPTVDVWVKQGLPALVQGSKGSAWEFDSVAVHQWLVAQAKKSRRTRGNRFGEGDDDSPGAMTIDDAKRRHEIAKAKTAEIELAKEMGAVAPIDTIAKVVSDEVANARARLLAIPTKFRPTAQMHAGSAEKVKKLVSAVDDLVRDALTEIKSYGGGE